MEANPELATQLQARFPELTRDGRLIVRNCVLTCEKEGGNEVHFFIHKTLDVRSQFPRPAADHMHQFTEIKLPSMVYWI